MNFKLSSLSIFTKNPLYTNENIRAGIFAFGLGYLLWKSFSLLKSIVYPAAFIREHNLLDRYGHGSWALITGASDGIGKAYCFELAKRGFNIILLARNEGKVTLVEKELRQTHPDIKTKILIADLVNGNNVEFYENIYKQVEELDISILVNNAGMIIRDYFHEIPMKSLQDQAVVNALPSLLLTRVLINKMRERGQRCALIFLSSLAA